MADSTLPSAGSEAGRILMESLGIRHALTDVFYYRDYRYGKFEDAIAQAKRDRDSSR